MTELPEYEDALTAPFWDGARRGRLLVQRCRDCGRHQLYPRPFCVPCASSDVEWVEAAGTGVVYSVTTVRMAVLPEFEPPYDVALVELDEGPRLLGRIVGGAVQIGDRVHILWEDCGEGTAPRNLFKRIDEEG